MRMIVCSRHEQAYSAAEGCPWCDEKPAQANPAHAWAGLDPLATYFVPVAMDADQIAKVRAYMMRYYAPAEPEATYAHYARVQLKVSDDGEVSLDDGVP